MAVRNLASIQRQGTMIVEVEKKEFQSKRDYIFRLINKIREYRADAIDALDTIKALNDNGLETKFQAWNLKRSIVPVGKTLRMEYNNFYIIYNPYLDDVEFSWRGCWHLSTQKYRIGTENNEENERSFIGSVTRKDRMFTYLLEKMDKEFKPYLNEFFAWVDTL